MGQLTVRNRIVGLAGVAIIVLSGVSTNTYAAYTQDDSFFNSNDIFNYCKPSPDNTCENNVDECAVGATDAGDVKVDDTETKKQIFQLLINGGMTSIQASAVMGNMQAESGFNADVHEVGNDIGYGLVQWSFGRRTNLENYAKAQGKPVSSVELQIDFLLKEYNDTYKAKLTGSAFDSGSSVKAATREWMMTFEVPAMQPPTDPARLNTVRIPAADKIYELYNELAPDPGSQTAVQDDCTADAENGVDGSSAVQGNIVQTALAYAWPYQIDSIKKAKSDARPSYQTAKLKWNPGPAWSDCGGFIATVMRSSGVDPDYVSVSVAAQTAYVRAHPNKYKIIDNPTAGDLQPGDILLSARLGHTSMYIGKNVIKGVNYTTAQASLEQTVPNLRRQGSAEVYMLGTGNAIVARYIGGTNE